MTTKRGMAVALRSVRRRGGAELARSSIKRLSEADGTSHVRALAFQSMFVVLSGFIGLVGLASAFDLPRVRRVVQELAATLSPGPSGRLLREAATQGAEGGAGVMFLGLFAATVGATLAMAQVERSANRLVGRSEDRPFARRYGVAFLLALSAGVLVAGGGLALGAGEAISVGLGTDSAGVEVWSVVRWPLGILVTAAGIYVLFRVAPVHKNGSAIALAVGTATAVTLWVVFSLAITLYFSVSTSSTYGPLLSIIALLLWCSSSSLALHMGLAFAAEMGTEESR